MGSRVKQILDKQFRGDKVKIIRFEARAPSFVAHFNAGEKELFLKIRKRWHHEALEESVCDSQLVETSKKEWGALKFLNEVCADEKCLAKFVTPVAYIEEIGGIVTERIRGRDLWEMLFLGTVSEIQKIDFLEKAGKALCSLHDRTISDDEPLEFTEVGTGNIELDRMIETTLVGYVGRLSPVSVSIRGLDIRDVIVNEKNEIVFCDPGVLGRAHRYKSLAQFIVSIKLIHQGAFSLLSQTVTAENYVQAFLRGYFGEGGDQYLLNLCVATELTRRYKRALKKLERRKIAKLPFFGWILRKSYIERYYFREIKKCIAWR